MSEDLGPASIAIGTATSAFMGFLPKFTDIRRSDPDDTSMIKDIRMGELAAVTVALGTGVIISSVTKSPLPAIVAAVMCVILITCYEKARKAV